MYNIKDSDQYFNSYINNQLVPCLSILAMRENKVICDFIGGCNWETDKSIDRNTRFNVGSVTKPVTASLIVKLLEYGLLTLNDMVQKFIPEYLFENVTIYHLLTHTAGYGEGMEVLRPQEMNGKEAYLRQIYSINTLNYSPGEISVYFTSGYSILMDIIERITSISLEEFAQEVLFRPTGMDSTTFEISKLKEDEYVLPYNKTEGRFETEIRKTPPTADTGLYTNTRDLIKFGEMILNKGIYNGKRIFAEPSVNLMLGECLDNKFMKTPLFWKKGSSDIHGCFGDLCSGTTVGHTGYSGCMLFIDPQNKVTAAILSNSMALHEDWKNYKKISNVIMSL